MNDTQYLEYVRCSVNVTYFGTQLLVFEWLSRFMHLPFINNFWRFYHVPSIMLDSHRWLVNMIQVLPARNVADANHNYFLLILFEQNPYFVVGDNLPNPNMN